MNRTDIATIAHWTLQRREFESGGYDYTIQRNERRLLIDLYVTVRPDFQTKRIDYEVTVTPSSRQLDLNEAVEFAALAQGAVIAARSFQHMIEAAEVMEEANA